MFQTAILSVKCRVILQSFIVLRYCYDSKIIWLEFLYIVPNIFSQFLQAVNIKKNKNLKS